MKPDKTYRFADAWIGAILGGFTGGVLAVAILLADYEEANSLAFGLIPALVAFGAFVCGLLGFCFGRHFTNAFDDAISAFWNYFSNNPD